jgi:subfamily B ATP-binding cassette protein MsbA
MRNRTTFVIAHRLSTVMHADKIVVLEQGKIVEVGRHLELLTHNGLYRRLFSMQFKDG